MLHRKRVGYQIMACVMCFQVSVLDDTCVAGISHGIEARYSKDELRISQKQVRTAVLQPTKSCAEPSSGVSCESELIDDLRATLSDIQNATSSLDFVSIDFKSHAIFSYCD